MATHLVTARVAVSACCHTGMNSLVNVERGFLREAFVTDIALERPLTGVSAHVYLQVRLASERRGTLHALIRPPLH